MSITEVHARMCPFSEIGVIIERDIAHRCAGFYHVITPMSDHIQMTSRILPCCLMTRSEKPNEHVSGESGSSCTNPHAPFLDFAFHYRAELKNQLTRSKKLCHILSN